MIVELLAINGVSSFLWIHAPSQITALRRTLKMSQPVFARMLNVGAGTAASWGNGRRPPSGPALKILHVAKKNPEALMELSNG